MNSRPRGGPFSLSSQATQSLTRGSSYCRPSPPSQVMVRVGSEAVDLTMGSNGDTASFKFVDNKAGGILRTSTRPARR